MRRALPIASLSLIFLGLVLQLFGVALARDADGPVEASARPERTPAMPRLAEDGGAGKTVVIVPIDGTIDLGLAPFVRRVVEEHQDAALIVLDVNTFGGRVDAAVQIRDVVLGSKAPTLAYVNPRAISAGALISYAAETLVFSPGGSMGAATPIQVQGGEAEAVDEKFVSYMRTEMRTTAEARGRSGLVAEAMVDRTVEVPGVISKERVLTVSTDLATEIGLADGVAPSLDALLAEVGLEDAERLEAVPSWSEDLARILTEPTLSGLLMSLGFLGIMIELYTPGFGLPGVLGVLCLVTFFAGHMVADLAGWEEVLLLTAGLVALGVEIFVIPGFGVVGVLGIVLIGGALAMSLTSMPLDLSWNLGFLTDALRRVLLSLGATVVALVVLIRFVPARVLPDWLVLRASIGEPKAPVEAGEADWRSAPDRARLVGQEGVATTPLRPSGKVRIGGELVDVVSLHSYIQPGTAVVVVQVEGGRVVVDHAAPPPIVEAERAGGDSSTGV